MEKINKTTDLKKLKNLFFKISSLNRMGNSNGMDQCFKILKTYYPDMKVHKFKVGSKAGDWTVPKNWSLGYSFLKDHTGKIIASTNESQLFVSPNSISVNEKVFGSKIIEKSMHMKKFPKCFLLNHKHTYNYFLRQKSWGISLPYERIKKIKNNNKYHISINTKFSNEPMKVGELFIKGKSKKIICIAAHIDELCNDNLSGSIAAIKLYEKLKKKRNFFSYQILLFPELYGPTFFINRFPHIIKNTLFMLNLETVGAGKKWCLKRSLKSNNFLENCLQSALIINNKKFKEMNFFDGFINDEKVYAWPKIDIPGVALQRYPYKHYHTSRDTIDKINFKYILECVKISEDFLKIFENKFKILKKNYIPEINFSIPPWLTKRKLYMSGKNSLFPQDEGNNTYNEKLLFSIDGRTSLLKLASKWNLKFENCYNFLEKFTKKKIVKKIKINDKSLLY